jgi:hypothetical protein
MSLHLAAWTGNVNAVKKFLQNAADITSMDPNGYTALHLAVWNMHTRVVAVLLGASRWESVKAQGRWSYLHFAVWNNDVQAIWWLLESCPSDNSNRSTVVRWAVDINHIAGLEALMEAEAMMEAEANAIIDFNPTLAFVKKGTEARAEDTAPGLVIGIDLGELYTGVAFLHTDLRSAERSKVAEKISIIRSWPSGGSQLPYPEKIPTALAYNYSPPVWGAKVRPSDKGRVTNFLAGLQNPEWFPADVKELRNTSEAEKRLTDYANRSLWPPEQAVDYCADYLSALCNYVTSDVLPRSFGSSFLRNQNLFYVITVPRTGSERSRDLTRQAAFRAGIPSENLALVTDSKAAALFYTAICGDLKVGDSFLVCKTDSETVALPHGCFTC